MSEKIKVAQNIIREIEYMNIASITPAGEPWNTPVYCSYDKNLNFYWASWKKNQHSVNVRENPAVFVTIYDSTAPAGEGEGVYFSGRAYELTKVGDILAATTCAYGRQKKKSRAVSEFLKKFPRRFYKFVPERAWLNTDGEIDGNFVDDRVELDLADLKNF